MGWLSRSLNRSIGKKFIMAVTGLFLILFLIEHIIGNYFLFGGEVSFNNYVELLESFGWITQILEIVLGLFFIFHIYYGIRLWLENRKAKPEKYAVNAMAENTTFTSRNAIYLGILLLIFLLIHLVNFWYTFKTAGQDASLYSIVVQLFANPYYSVFYIFTFVILGLHINHGFQSAFQTLGWNHPKYFPIVKKLGSFIAIIFTLGFAIIPIYFYFVH